MGRYITGFKTEQDARLTLEAMEKRGWRWRRGQNPTEWNGWKDISINYNNLSISYEDLFGWSILPKEDTIDFRDAIRELGGEVISNVSSLPEYFYIERDLNDPRWMKFIDWINDTYGTSFIGETYLYYGWDGYKGGKSCYYDPVQFERNPTRITLDEWETIVQDSLHEPSTTTEVEIPEYFTISSRNNKHLLWVKYIAWLNKKYDTNPFDTVTGTNDGFYGSHKNGDKFNEPHEMRGEEEITLEFWSYHMDDSINLPTYATEDMIAPKVRMATIDYTDPSTGINTPEPADLSLRTATGASAVNWASTRVDGNDPLRMAHDAAMYGTAVSYATPNSINDSIYESYRQAGKAYNATMNAWIDKQSIQGPTPSQVFIDEAVNETPTKTSRYSSMLDLI